MNRFSNYIPYFRHHDNFCRNVVSNSSILKGYLLSPINFELQISVEKILYQLQSISLKNFNTLPKNNKD